MARTLVLNRSFRAVAVADWRRAVTLVYMGLAEALDEQLTPYDFQAWIAASSNWVEMPAGFVSSPNVRFAVPEVIRLVRYDRIPHREVAFTRHNVFARDRYRCAYCGRHAMELNHDNGPLLVEGSFKLVDAAGNEFQLPTDKPAFALCRCEKSRCAFCTTRSLLLTVTNFLSHCSHASM